ncbi:D-2-hydroxyacid dehydrogenase [Oscillospiraceae bacterium OttesenSCG-928-G22]|nr:D-2-hydroxyacid dehydrogenase [Oscillospiraceae bacterium OttesenSCG-928-G22]
MKIVILDGYTLNPGDLDWKGLEALGDVTIYDRTPASETVSRIGDAEIVFTNKTLVTEEVFAACPNIRFVGVLATGFNIVDTEAAKKRGIPVSNVPTYGTAAVSQFVFALLLEICHHVGHHSQTVVDGRWGAQDDYCYWDYPLIELSGLTMGIIGLGRIGKATAKIANAFGMKVLANDAYRDASIESDDLRYVELDELLRNSDVISLHCPLLPDTEGMINRESIAKMKDGVLLINTSRGPLIVEDALVEALNTGKVAGAAVDVLHTEPPKKGSVLIGAKNCIVTPHIAWAPLASRRRLMNVAVDNLTQFLAGNPINVVNP